MPRTQPEGFLATPVSGDGSPVLVLHAWWGLNDTAKAFCTRLSESGFTAFAPDLYHGKVAKEIPDAETLVKALFAHGARANAEAAEAGKFIYEHCGQPAGGVAVIGFSMGANLALDLAADHPDLIRSVVLFYGTGGADFSRSRASFLGHFAENDDFEPRASVNELEETLQSAGRPVTFHQYPGTGHWFFEPDRTDAYDRTAADLAWDRTLDFLRDPSA